MDLSSAVWRTISSGIAWISDDSIILKYISIPVSFPTLVVMALVTIIMIEGKRNCSSSASNSSGEYMPRPLISSPSLWIYCTDSPSFGSSILGALVWKGLWDLPIQWSPNLCKTGNAAIHFRDSIHILGVKNKTHYCGWQGSVGNTCLFSWVGLALQCIG